MRCDLCVEQNVLSKKELRDKELRELMEFEQRNQSLITHQQLDSVKKKPVTPSSASPSLSRDRATNKNDTTRLYLRNMCRHTVTEEKLMEVIPNITHIVWKVDGKSGTFFGQGWAEVKSPEDAEYAVSQSGKIIVCGRALYIEYQPPDGKDLWPPPRSAVHQK